MRIAVIPARGGSRRVPRKNVRDFMGYPMISYPLRAARACGLFDLIVVSTDDAEIAAVAFDYNACVLPRDKDDGSTGTQELAGRVLDQLNAHGNAACVIYPTSPLMTPQDLIDGWNALLSPVSLSKCFARSVGPDGQDAGCMYWGWIRAFRDRRPLDTFNTHDFALPAERVCDIDVWFDWHRAEAMFTALRRANQ